MKQEEIQYNYNGWNEWAKYVLKSIERLEINQSLLEDKTVANKEELLREVNSVKDEFKKQFDSLKDYLNEQRIETKEYTTKFKTVTAILAFVGGALASFIFSIILKIII
jgi:hypothetical protein